MKSVAHKVHWRPSPEWEKKEEGGLHSGWWLSICAFQLTVCLSEKKNCRHYCCCFGDSDCQPVWLLWENKRNFLPCTSDLPEIAGKLIATTARAHLFCTFFLLKLDLSTTSDVIVCCLPVCFVFILFCVLVKESSIPVLPFCTRWWFILSEPLNREKAPLKLDSKCTAVY